VLEDISAGRPVRRRDAVALARDVLDSDVVRAAEAVLAADDAVLLTRVVDFLRFALAGDATAVVARPRG
jgi:hypothetical protein